MTTDLTVQPDKSLTSSYNQLQIDDFIMTIPFETLNKRIFNQFIYQAQNEVNAFQSSYDELKNVKNLLKNIKFILEKHLLNFCVFSLGYLKKIECFEYSSEDLLDIAIENGPIDRWENLYKELSETEITIDDREGNKDDYRTLRRKNRKKTYWTTNTAGWGEKMMYNAAGGMLHGGFNIMAKGASAIKTSSEKKGIFKEYKEEFSKIFFGFCSVCYEFVAENYTQKGIPCASIGEIRQTNKKSRNIFKNAVDAGVEYDKLKRIIAECIALDCYNIEFHEALIKLCIESSNAKSNIGQLSEFSERIMPGQLKMSPAVNELFGEKLRRIVESSDLDLDSKSREARNIDDILSFIGENKVIIKTFIMYQILQDRIRSQIDETVIAGHIAEALAITRLDINTVLSIVQNEKKEQIAEQKIFGDYYYQLIIKIYKKVEIIDQIDQLVVLVEAVLNNVENINSRVLTDFLANVLENEVLNFPDSLKTVRSVNERLNISEDILSAAVQGNAKNVRKHFPVYISNTCAKLEATQIPDIKMTFAVCGLDPKIESEIIEQGVIASINGSIKERISNEVDQIDFSVENKLNGICEFVSTHFSGLSAPAMLSNLESVKNLYRHQLKRIVFSTESIEQRKASVLKLEKLLPWITGYYIVSKDLLIKEFIEQFFVAANSDISIEHAINDMLEACGITPATLLEQLHEVGKESSLKKLNKKQAAECLKQLLIKIYHEAYHLDEKKNCIDLLSMAIANIEAVYASLLKSFLASTLETEIEKFPAHVKNLLQIKTFLDLSDKVFEAILNDIQENIRIRIHPEIVRACNDLDSQRLAEILEACNRCMINAGDIENLYKSSILESIRQAIGNKIENKTALVEFMEEGINSELKKIDKDVNINEIWMSSSAKHLISLLWDDGIIDSRQYQFERNAIALSPSDQEQIDKETYDELKQRIFARSEVQLETENIGSKALKYLKQKMMKGNDEPVENGVNIVERIEKPLHWLEKVGAIIGIEDSLLKSNINKNAFLMGCLNGIESLFGEFEKTEDNAHLNATIDALNQKSVYISRSSIWMYFVSNKPKNNFVVSLSGIHMANGTSIPFSSIEAAAEAKGITQRYIKCLLKSGEEREIKNIKDSNLISQLVFILNNGKQLCEHFAQGEAIQQFGSGEALGCWVDKPQLFEHICEFRLPRVETVLRQDATREYSREIFLPALLEGNLIEIPEAPELKAEDSLKPGTDSNDGQKKVFDKFKKLFSKK